MNLAILYSNRRHRPLLAVVAVALALVLAVVAPMAAQEDEPAPVYTRVALWQVERAQWGRFVDLFKQYDQGVMDQAMTDGLIIEWGLDASSLHQPDGYTHVTWFSSDSIAGLEKTLDLYETALAELAEEEQESWDAEFAAMVTKHRDYLMRNMSMRSRAGDLEGAYYLASSSTVKQRRGRDWTSSWKANTRPVYEQLFADGIIAAYGYAVEQVHTSKPGEYESWCIAKDAEAIDAVNDAFRAVWEALSDEQRRARWASILSVNEERSHRDHMSETIVGQQSDH
jgi:hypothetical protein